MQKIIVAALLTCSVFSKDLHAEKGYYPGPGQEAIMPEEVDDSSGASDAKKHKEYNPKQPKMEDDDSDDEASLFTPSEGKGYFPKPTQ